jgi:oxalate decarboxylase/phosphoglucose isomerase-like protein (cupin superfamily)
VTSTRDSFDPANFEDEIGAASTNFRIATAVLLETGEVRIWDFLLPPAYRHPFHCHRTNYCWVCTMPGRGLQRLTDGTMTLRQFSVGEVDFSYASPDAPLIHDLENVGDAPLRFSTIELLG